MRKRSKLLLFLGIFLIFCSVLCLLLFQLHGRTAQKRAEEICHKIEEVLPQKSRGMKDIYTEMEMPVLSVEKQDFCGIITFPDYDRKLPIANLWNAKKTADYPCRFYGTVYDGSLILGGSDQEGQFDCLKWLENGSLVTVTNMLGEEFLYKIYDIEHAESAKTEILLEETAELTLFVRDTYSMNYIIVRCIGE